MFVTTNVMNAKTKVIAIFPVTFAPPGRSPSKLLTKIKKNKVSRYGKYFVWFFPMFGCTMSSLTKTTNGSINDAKPLGAPSFFLDLRPTLPKINSRRTKEIKREAAFFVIERSTIGKPLSS